jgi:hypothetical protein
LLSPPLCALCQERSFFKQKPRENKYPNPPCVMKMRREALLIKKLINGFFKRKYSNKAQWEKQPLDRLFQSANMGLPAQRKQTEFLNTVVPKC